MLSFRRVVPIVALMCAAGESAANTASEGTADESVVERKVDWDKAPLPTQASGVARDESDGGAAAFRWVPRAILFLPRWGLWLAVAPVRGAAFVYEKYQLRERARRIFFNDEGTFGAYPVGFFETNFGLNIGGRLISRDVLGRKEQLRLRASYGGRFRQIYSMKATSGERFGRADIELKAGLEIRPKDLFFGIGNADVSQSPTTPIRALDRDRAVETRFRQEVVRFVLGVNTHIAGPLSLKPSAALMFRSFGTPDDADNGPFSASVFEEESLIGFSDGLANVYGELELRYDSRRRTSDYLTEALPATGWLLSGFAGYATGFEDDPSDYWRYGFDVQRFINVYGGNRVLSLRLFTEAVTGRTSDVPFVDLPPLGGPDLLRGYSQDRFRDRAATLGSVEYIYELEPSSAASLFVDAGRVWQTLRDFDFEDFRVGFGASLSFHTKNSFLTRASIASSIDGGFFFNLSFDPVYEVRRRAGRH